MLNSLIKRQLVRGLIILTTFTAIGGCWSHLGQDNKVSDKNERIAAAVKVAIAQEPTLNVAPINIRARKGVVTLEGFVENETQRKQAAEVAKNAKGVQSVINNIQIK
ncbi:BON domain-containing protein [Candidatus Nitrospira salsa]